MSRGEAISWTARIFLGASLLALTACALPLSSAIAPSPWPVVVTLPVVTTRTLMAMTPTSTPTPEYPSPAGKIVYTCQISRDAEHNEICLMNADGSGFRQLTANGANNGFASLSPDGQSVVYTSNFSGSWQIYELTLTDFTVRQLTFGPGEASAPAISPDGTKIVYKCSLRLDSICIMDRDGSHARRIYTPGWDPVWSPDGSRLLFASGPLAQPSLYIVSVSDSSVQQILTLKDMRGRSDWSVQDRIVTYAGQRWQRNIYLWDGTTWIQLTQGGNSVGPSFSPDGNWIAFTAYFDHMYEPDGCEIYIMTVTGEHLTRLTDNDYCDWQPRWGR